MSRPPAYVVDLGCGTGRDAVFLAAHGWHVLAVDRLPDAVDRGALTARRLLGEQANRIEWRIEDVAHFDIPEHDLLLMIRFLNRSALEKALPRLSHGGVIALETYTPAHRERTGKPRDPSLTLNAETARALLPGFHFEQLEELADGDRHILRLIAEKAAQVQ